MMEILFRITAEVRSCGLWLQEQNPKMTKGGGRKYSVNTASVNSIMKATHSFCQEQAVDSVRQMNISYI